MVFLVEYQVSIRRKGKQALGGFDVLDLGMIKLACQLPILQNRCAKDEKQQNQSEYAYIPQCEPMADVRISQHYGSSSQRGTESHPAHGMQQAFFWKSPSSLRRSRVICTSITLSNGV